MPDLVHARLCQALVAAWGGRAAVSSTDGETEPVVISFREALWQYCVVAFGLRIILLLASPQLAVLPFARRSRKSELYLI